MISTKKWAAACLSMSLSAALLFGFSQNIQAETQELSLNIASTTYTGSYTGSLKENLPDGQGVFSVSDIDDPFSLSGIWRNGYLNGSVKCEYSDGRYSTEHFADGRPYGRIINYNKSNSITGCDFYYQMRTIANLKESCVEADYNKLIGTDFPNLPQKIIGTVSAVFSTCDHAFILLHDMESHPYVLTYSNNSTDKFNQAIVPNLKKGDVITAYGYLQRRDSLKSLKDTLAPSLLVTDAPDSMESLSDLELSEALADVTADTVQIYNEISSTTLPFILLFAADTEDNIHLNLNAPDYTYENLINNPYLYSGLTYDFTATVKQCVAQYDKNYLQLIVSENDTDNLFYLRYQYSDGAELPATGDTITIHGILNGNYKQIIPADGAKIIRNSSSLSSDAETKDANKSIDESVAFIDSDSLDKATSYDNVAYVILYPRLSTTDISIN